MRALKSEKGDFHLTIKIEDTGMGSEDDKLEEIFEFAYTSKKSGSGVGLSLSKQIIEEHQGSIYAESTINVGTIIYIVLPLKHEGSFDE